MKRAGKGLNVTDDTWNPAQYERFKAMRAQPLYDLAALITRRPGLEVVDLGCGTGEMTRWLHQELGAKGTLGIDSSQAMLEKSAHYAAPGLRFEKADIRDFSAAEAAFDLVFSNAALHWLPHHEELIARLTRWLRPGGQLAVQMPDNGDHPSHFIAGEVAREPAFLEALKNFAIPRHVLEPEKYATLLHRLGYEEQVVKVQVYGHLLDSKEEVVEWVKGTLMTDYQKRLSPELYARFVERYRARLLPRLEDTAPYFYSYRRTFLWARRPS